MLTKVKADLSDNMMLKATISSAVRFVIPWAVARFGMELAPENMQSLTEAVATVVAFAVYMVWGVMDKRKLRDAEPRAVVVDPKPTITDSQG